MSKRELIEAFVRGEVDRRDFVRRLTLLGVSGGAAAAYAATLGQTVAASSSVNAAGFAVRAQTGDDEDYGLEEAIQALVAAIIALLLEILNDIFGNFDDFFGGDFGDGVFDSLATVREQTQVHLDTLQALGGQIGGIAGTSTRMGFQAQTFASADEFIGALADDYQRLVALYAAAVPAVPCGQDEARQTLMQIASVANRHAALLNVFAGRDPLPDAFQEAELPES